ncbi:MAG: CBS domain-containing membrane protein [Neolewinella sp.]
MHHIPIVDEADQLIGIISHRDVLSANSSSLRSKPGSDYGSTLIGDIMVTDVVTISPTAGTLKAAQYIHNSRHGCLPVLDDGKLVGIVTEYDFVEVAMSLLERRQRTEFTEEDAEDLASDNLQSADELGLDVSAAQNWD